MDFSKYLGEVGLAELWNLMTAYVDDRIDALVVPMTATEVIEACKIEA